jgi:protocatechuate 3,4-dioxygenase beta subunit
MNPMEGLLTRRNLLRGGLAVGASTFFVRGAYADELTRTPSVTEGPFYPPKLPLDTDNDLIVINDNITPAVGEITHLSGRILSTSGEPMRNIAVEIWQCDGKGVYIAQDDGEGRDSNFQGFGRFMTSSTGEYYFRTIKPVPYPGRTPHIHVKLKKGDRELLTTQLFINGHPQNRSDGIFQGVGGPFEKELVLVDFKPLKDSKIGETTARMDIVVGLTPAEPPHDDMRPPRRRRDSEPRP